MLFTFQWCILHLLIVGIIGESRNAHIAIFHDFGDIEAIGAIDKAESGFETGLLKSHGVKNLLFSKIPMKEKNLTGLVKTFLSIHNHTAITLVMDLSKIPINSAYAKNIVKAYHFPAISTNDWDFNRMYVVDPWKQITTTQNKYLIQLHPPETLYQDIMMKIVIKRSIHMSVLQIGNQKQGVIHERSGQRIRIENIKQRVNIRKSVRLLGAETVFLIDVPSQMRKTLKTASNYDGKHENLLNERYSWWAISKHVNEVLKCQKFVKEIMFVSPEPTNNDAIGNATELFKTKNLNQLFYINVIQAAVETYSNVKKKELWKAPTTKKADVFKVDFRTGFERILTSDDNMLGPFVNVGPLKVLLLDTVFKMKLITPNKILPVGTIHITKNNSPVFDIQDNLAWNSYYPGPGLSVLIVVDPPFVIRNDSCIADYNGEKVLQCYTGYVMDLLQYIREHSDIGKMTIKFEEEYGKPIEGVDAWDGGIGKIGDDEVDIGIGAFAMNPEREDYVTFSEPFYTDVDKNVSYGFAFQNFIRHHYIQNIFSELITDLTKLHKLEQLSSHWFIDYNCNCTLSSDH